MNNTYGSGGELPYRDMEAAVRALTAKKIGNPEQPANNLKLRLLHHHPSTHPTNKPNRQWFRFI